MRICVVIPAYNGAKTIGGLIKAVKAYVADVIVVNDGSRDETERVSRGAGAYVVSFKENVGKGTALKTGFDYAVKNNYDAVITMDADGQHLPEDIPAIMNKAASPEIGVVVGNRMASPGNMPFVRVATNFFMSLMISAICRQVIPDTQCGFRLIKCSALKDINLISAKYEVETEILIKASRRGLKIASAPIKSVYEGQMSLINPVADTWRFFAMLFKVLR